MKSQILIVALILTLTGCENETGNETVSESKRETPEYTSEFYRWKFTEGRDIRSYIAIIVVEDTEVSTGKLGGGIRFEIFRNATITKSLKGNFKEGDLIEFHHAYETSNGEIPKIGAGNKAIIFIHDEDDTGELFYLDTGDYLRRSPEMEDGLLKALETLNSGKHSGGIPTSGTEGRVSGWLSLSKIPGT